MNPHTLTETRATRAAATAGQWGAEREGGDLVVLSYQVNQPVCIVGDADDPQVNADAAFIKSAPATIDALLAEVDRLTGELNEVRQADTPGDAIAAAKWKRWYQELEQTRSLDITRLRTAEANVASLTRTIAELTGDPRLVAAPATTSS